jgi:lipoprotein-releasing system permease protein
MKRNVSLFLGFRHLRRRGTFVSAITLISVTGVMLGVAVMVMVMAIFKGWQVEFRQMLLGFEPHVILSHDYYEDQEVNPDDEEESNWRQVLELAASAPGVTSAMPVVTGTVVVDSGGELEGMEIMGLMEDADDGIAARLVAHLKEGGFDLEGDHIVLTDRMAARLGVGLGDTVTVNSVRNLQHMVRALEEIEEETDESARDAAYEEAYSLGEDLMVAGILRADTAGGRGYMPLHLARSLFGLDDRVTAINLELADPEQAGEVERWLLTNEAFPMDWFTQIWQDRARHMLESVENQQSLLYFLLLFIVLVAAICVMNTTITVTVQKRREIGILTALGARQGQVMAVFLSQAFVVASAGVALGVGLGCLLLAWRNEARAWIAEWTGRDFFPQDIYFLSSIPAKVDGSDLVAVCGMALVLCLAAALIPSWVAARVDPAVALRDAN